MSGSVAAASPSSTAVFPFTSAAIVGFYESEGFTCGAAVPSTVAAGWTVRTCQGDDAAGHPLAIGVMTDDNGILGAGFASVTARPEEDLLEPTDALDALSGFLGAMLDQAAATDQLPWLAGHVGDDYAEVSIPGASLATYTEAPDDPTRIYVEVDGEEYLAAPPP